MCFQEIMTDVIKIVKCSQSQGFNHCEFQGFVEVKKALYKDLFYHTEDCSSSRGKVLKWAFDLKTSKSLWGSSNKKKDFLQFPTLSQAEFLNKV